MPVQIASSTQFRRLRFGGRIPLKTLTFSSFCLVFLFTSLAPAQVKVADMPIFSPAAGTYSSAQTVTISTTTASATIYYTTNGTTPTTNSNCVFRSGHGVCFGNPWRPSPWPTGFRTAR